MDQMSFCWGSEKRKIIKSWQRSCQGATNYARMDAFKVYLHSHFQVQQFKPNSFCLSAPTLAYACFRLSRKPADKVYWLNICNVLLFSQCHKIFIVGLWCTEVSCGLCSRCNNALSQSPFRWTAYWHQTSKKNTHILTRARSSFCQTKSHSNCKCHALSWFPTIPWQPFTLKKAYTDCFSENTRQGHHSSHAHDILATAFFVRADRPTIWDRKMFFWETSSSCSPEDNPQVWPSDTQGEGRVFLCSRCEQEMDAWSGPPGSTNEIDISVLMTGIRLLGNWRARHRGLLLGWLQQIHRTQTHSQWAWWELCLRRDGCLERQQIQMEDMGRRNLEILGRSYFVERGKGILRANKLPNIEKQRWCLLETWLMVA